MQNKYPTKKEAVKMLFKKWNIQTETEIVSIDDSVNRISAEKVYSVNTLPVVRSSKMDGVATNSKYFKNGMPNTSKWKKGVEYERADTGDDFPDKYDMVIQIEAMELLEDGGIEIDDEILEEIKPGMGVNPSGRTVKKGDLILDSNIRIRPHNLAALAIGGAYFIKVYKKPRVAFIPTGSELISEGVVPSRGENTDSNSLMIKHMLIEMGAEPVMFPIVKDVSGDLENALDKALEIADIAVINGGSSKGEEDLNTELIRRKGALIQHGAAAGPGMPIGIGIIENKPVINLPGPNIAAFYGAEWCLKEIVSKYYSLNPCTREQIKAVLQEDFTGPEHMSFLSKMVIKKDSEGNYLAYPRKHTSCSAIEAASGNAYFILPIGEDFLPKGTEIEVQLLVNKSDIRFCEE